MIGRIVRPADFERVLGAPQRSKSVHFAVHHVPDAPSGNGVMRVKSTADCAVVPRLPAELSTGGVDTPAKLVDDSGRWLGLVVPKRHAKRAVTRNLIKRQLRAAMMAHASSLPAGMWVVRLRAPFDRTQFISPASEALRHCAHEEIAGLFERAAHSPLPARPSRPPRASGRR